jgi:hypothetical protein
MKAAGIIQVVIILLLLACAASCEVGKEYSKRVFKTKPENKTNVSSIKFLKTDSSEISVTYQKSTFKNLPASDSVKPDKSVAEESLPSKTSEPGKVRTKRVRH